MNGYKHRYKVVVSVVYSPDPQKNRVNTIVNKSFHVKHRFCCARLICSSRNEQTKCYVCWPTQKSLQPPCRDVQTMTIFIMKNEQIFNSLVCSNLLFTRATNWVHLKKKTHLHIKYYTTYRWTAHWFTHSCCFMIRVKVRGLDKDINTDMITDRSLWHLLIHI